MSNQDFIDLIADEHGVYVAAPELEQLQIELHQLASQRRLLPYYSFEPRADLGKIIFIVAGALLGGFLLPGLGLASGFVGGALLGAAIGYRLAGAFDSKASGNRAKEITADAVFAFGDTGELVLLGSPIPVIYTNEINSYVNTDGETEGGLFLEAKTIYSRIAPTQGSQAVTKLGVLAAGKIGYVEQTTMLLGDQPRSAFATSDVVSAITDGSYNQTALGGISTYCQAASQQANAFLGIGEGVLVQAITNPAAAGITYTNLSNTTYSAGTLSQTVPTAFSTAKSQNITLTGNYGDFIQFSGKGGQIGTTKGFRLTTADTSIQLTVYIEGSPNQYSLYVGVTLVYGPFIYNAAMVFSARIYKSLPLNYLQVLLDGTEIWRGTTTINSAVWAEYFLVDGTATLTNLDYQVGDNSSITNTLDILPGLGKRFRMTADKMDLLKSDVLYTSNLSGDPNSVAFKIVAKNPVGGYVETDTVIWLSEANSLIPIANQGARGGSNLYPRYAVSIATSKAVNQLEIVFLANLDARDDQGNLLQFGSVFEVSLNDGTGFQSLGRLMISTKSATQIYRSLLIGNLPLKTYRVKIQPIIPNEISASTWTIGEANNQVTTTTAANFGAGLVTLSYDQGIQYSAADAKIIADPAAGGKFRTSADQAPVIRITHLNEIVVPASAPTYPGYTVGQVVISASDRIQSVPAVLWDIRRGRVCRAHLAAGTITGASANLVQDITAHFLDDGIALGDTIRLLESGSQRVITGLSNGSVVCDQIVGFGTQGVASHLITVSAGVAAAARVGMPIVGVGIPAGAFIEKITGLDLVIGDAWGRKVSTAIAPATPITLNANAIPEVGTNYVIFSYQSSNYYPDVFVDRLVNPADGLGGLVNEDYFINYPSIVKSRKFCIDRQFYFDGTVEAGSFETWATETAPSSLLYPTKINGQYALIPEQNERIKGIFNAHNLIDYSEPYTEWQAQAVNTVLVGYSDKRGRSQQVKIYTLEVDSGLESELSTTIELKGVRNRAQAMAVGGVALKSLKLQSRVCKFTTDIGSLTAQHGDIIRTQHAIVEYTGESSGFVLSAQSPANLRTELSPVLCSISKTSIGAGGTTVITCSQPHGLVDGDTIQIAGHTFAGINGVGIPDIYDDVRLSLPVAYTAGTGGTIQKSRQVFDQAVTLSEVATVGVNSRISIAHVATGKTEVDLQFAVIGDLPVVIGLESELMPNDLFIIGQEAEFSRTWRISSLKPNLSENTAEIVAVLWDVDILSLSNLVVI